MLMLFKNIHAIIYRILLIAISISRLNLKSSKLKHKQTVSLAHEKVKISVKLQSQKMQNTERKTKHLMRQRETE